MFLFLHDKITIREKKPTPVYSFINKKIIRCSFFFHLSFASFSLLKHDAKKRLYLPGFSLAVRNVSSRFFFYNPFLAYV